MLHLSLPSSSESEGITIYDGHVMKRSRELANSGGRFLLCLLLQQHLQTLVYDALQAFLLTPTANRFAGCAIDIAFDFSLLTFRACAWSWSWSACLGFWCSTGTSSCSLTGGDGLRHLWGLGGASLALVGHSHAPFTLVPSIWQRRGEALHGLVRTLRPCSGHGDESENGDAETQLHIARRLECRDGGKAAVEVRRNSTAAGRQRF